MNTGKIGQVKLFGILAHKKFTHPQKKTVKMSKVKRKKGPRKIYIELNEKSSKKTRKKAEEERKKENFMWDKKMVFHLILSTYT